MKLGGSDSCGKIENEVVSDDRLLPHVQSIHVDRYDGNSDVSCCTDVGNILQSIGRDGYLGLILGRHYEYDSPSANFFTDSADTAADFVLSPEDSMVTVFSTFTEVFSDSTLLIFSRISSMAASET